MKRNVIYALVIVVIALVYSACGKESTKRYKDESFPDSLEVFNRTIACGDHTPGSFPSKTWTCANISVDGNRLAFGYSDISIGECTDTKGKHEFMTLCKEMLKQIDIYNPIWSVYVPKPTCKKDLNKRAILVKKGKKYIWEDKEPGKGYVLILQCMIQI
ncbi:hypothetical protein LOTGIDRAFT_235628 [Lottia gigantea]|uniref:Lipoprotein n=1 Tax=Lottia gigantea TaxID=225164 RepID=V4BAQ8_LOTGI|nr:hypothetical protein LOTGIDRAFT_235628 [Lottia gigantea]ESO86049.1 hypothetical protein LOTGIDRAFT_235628 [Lottia gigantea]